MTFDRQTLYTLYRAAWNALYQTHQSTLSKGAPSEPKHVRDFARQGSERLFNGWAPILRKKGIDIRVTGVFCHQTPYATFDLPPDGGRCELGDLLIVHEHLTPQMQRRAMLLQAKIANRGIPTGSINSRQEHLYRHWPDFALHGSGSTDSHKTFLDGKRDVRSNIDGAFYAFIELTSSSHPWRIASPIAVGRTVDAAFVLVSMILGLAGRTSLAPINRLHDPSDSTKIAPNVPSDLHWAITVEELIRITACRVLSKTTQTISDETRGHSFDFFQSGQLPTSVNLLGAGERFHGVANTSADLNGPSDGMGIIIIETAGELDLGRR